MSLQVWLPLIDNTDNYGLSDLQFSAQNGNYTYRSTVGVLNKYCYKNTSTSAGAMCSDRKLNIGNHLSMFTWVYIDSYAENPTGIGGMHAIHGSGYPAANGMSMNINLVGGNHVVGVSTGTGSARTWGDYNGATNIPTGIWQHIGFTYDNSHIRIYVNGKLDATYAYTGQYNPADYVHLFSWARDEYSYPGQPNVFYAYQTIGKLQDFRVYDHVLTTKEIKELSKGLMAHWKMDNIASRYNYMQGAVYTKNNPLVRNANEVGHMYDSYTYHHGVWNVTLTEAGTYTFIVESNGVPAGGHPTSGTTAKQNLFSWFLQHVETSNHYHLGMKLGQNGESYQEIYLPAGTYIVRSNLYAADSVNYTLKFWNFRLHKGGYYDEVWNTKRCPDSSGYGHHGVSAGAPADYNADSPRYSSSSHFRGGTGYTAQLNTEGLTEFSISAWVNPSSYGDDRLIVRGGCYFAIDNSGYARTYCYGKSPEGWHTSSFKVPLNTWSHLVAVWSSNQMSIYANGNQVYSSSCTGTASIGYDHYLKMIGHEALGRAFQGKLSDIRMYGTALSAEEVKELYNTPISLLKTGKLMLQEGKENNNAISFKKRGVVTSANFVTRKLPINNMRVKMIDYDGSAWARLHYLDRRTDKTLFANASEVLDCDKSNRYSKMGMANKFQSSDGNYEFMLTYPSLKKMLPNGYTQLEYIETRPDGGQWIYTGISAASVNGQWRGHRWEHEIQFLNTTDRQLMGYGPNGYEYWGVISGGYEGTPNSSLGKKDIVIHDYQGGTLGGNKLHIVNQNTYRDVGSNLASGQQYAFFALPPHGFWCKSTRLYRSRCIAIDGKILRDFVPAQRDIDGYVGLYDIVEGIFYENAATENLTKYCGQNQVVYNYAGVRNFKKTYGGAALVATVQKAGPWNGPLIVSLDPNSVTYYTDGDHNSGHLGYSTTVQYRGKTWYVCNQGAWYAGYGGGSAGSSHLNSLTGVETYPSMEAAALDLLKYYYERSFIPGPIHTHEDDYVPLEYVESNGLQYINTGINPTSNTRLVIKASSTGPYSLYGMTGGGTSFNMTGNGNGQYFYWGGQAASAVTNWYGQVHTFEQNRNQCFVDGNLYHTFTASSWNAPYPIFLFARSGNGALSDIGGQVRIYECQIYDNDVLLRDFIPVASANGEAGMFDRVQNKFYTSENGNKFPITSTGTNINKDGYEFLEYIRMGGDGYINTGVVETTVYGVDFGVSVVDVKMAWQSLMGGVLDHFTIGTHNTSPSAAYLRIRGAEIFNAAFGISTTTKPTMISIKKGVVYIDDKRVGTYSHGILSNPSTASMIVVGNNNSGNRGSYIRVHHLSLYDGNHQLIRNFHPVKKGSQVGLYDTVTETFYPVVVGSASAGPTANKKTIEMYNRWRQTNSPEAGYGGGTGYFPIATCFGWHPNSNSGQAPITLSPSSGSARYSMNTVGNWWAPIGQYSDFGSGIPAADGATRMETELWVRTDKLATTANTMSVQKDKALIANDFMEI